MQIDDFDFAATVRELSEDDVAYAAAIEQVGAAQALINALNGIAGTKNRKPTLRMALDEASRERYERSGELKRAVMVGGTKIGDYTACLTAPSDEKKVARLEVDDLEALMVYIQRDKTRLYDLIEDNLEALLEGYLNDGEVPDGTHVAETVVPAEPQVYKYSKMNVDSRALPDLDGMGAKLLEEVSHGRG